MHIRTVPKLEFRYDEVVERAARLSALIDAAVADDAASITMILHQRMRSAQRNRCDQSRPPSGQWGFIAGQANRLDLECGAASGQATVSGAKGRPHRQPRSAGQRVVADLFGRGHQAVRLLLNADKAYRFTCLLGATTTTGDAEGEVVTTRPVGSWSRTQIEAALQQFIGPIQQIPPMYSA
jgi:hypothetical protein